MKTVFGEDGAISVRERDLPEPRPGWVRVAVTVSGICGSDLHLLHGRFGPNRGIQPGHEIAGIVDAVGTAVTGCESGALVAIEPLVGCGDCHFCGVGTANLCPDNRMFGFALPGGLAQHVCVPAAVTYPLDPSLDARAAGLTEPFAVCVRGVRLAQVGVGDRVAVLGAGSIGLLSILAARHAGAAELLAYGTAVKLGPEM